MSNLLTERCTLKELGPTDYTEIFKLYSNDKVRQFLGGTVDEATFGSRFDQILRTTKKWTVRTKEYGAFLGLIVIDAHHDENDQEISYQYLPEFWGKGLASETVGAIIKYASDIMNLPSIVAETQAANMSSRQLLEKLGMKIDRIFRFDKEQIIYRKNF